MSERKNGEPESQKKQVEKPKRNEEQYKLLIVCSIKGDLTEWREHCKKHPNEKIWLQGARLWEVNLQSVSLFKANMQGANLERANMQGANLFKANLQDANLERANMQAALFWGANLQGASLKGANLQVANFWEANLQDANLKGASLQDAYFAVANMQGANFEGANMQGANFERANLQGANFERANLQGANFEGANLQGANFEGANLQGANFEGANLQGVKLEDAELQGANFKKAIVEGKTLIWECKVNRYSQSERFTDFESVGLDSIRIDPETKQLLEYNIRRKNWEEWYKGKSENKWVIKMRRLATSPIRLFWSISDYGLSTGRIILTFFVLAIIFATIYFVLGAVDYCFLGIKDEPGIVRNLFIKTSLAEPMWGIYYSLMVYFRAIYFSIVTMTTLGFGDMYANDLHFGFEWWLGHSLLILQVILGYVLLGALVTRFAVLFTAGGPAGKFAKSRLKEK